MKRSALSCPLCLYEESQSFYRQEGVPVHSVVLLRDREEALRYPTHRIDLHLCSRCGFIFNADFDQSLMRYGPDYDGSQSHSERFRKFHNELADSLIERFGLKGELIVEIGCGQGDFLQLLCRGERNRGLGYDPSYLGISDSEFVRIEPRVFEEAADDLSGAGLVVGKMTLEHIAQPRQFVQNVAAGCAPGTRCFFQVPSTQRILDEGAFWGIYFEHCSYFRENCFHRLFEENGFRVLEVWKDYDDQYLMLDAVREQHPASSSAADLGLGTFVQQLRLRRQWIQDIGVSTEGPILFWGAGSKAVALTHRFPEGRVSAAVDVNPAKWDTYLPASGLPVISPSRLTEWKPEMILVLNSIYLEEVRSTLAGMPYSCRLEALR